MTSAKSKYTQILRAALADIARLPPEEARGKTPVHARVMAALPGLPPEHTLTLSRLFGMNGYKKRDVSHIAKKDEVPVHEVALRARSAFRSLGKEVWGPVVARRAVDSALGEKIAGMREGDTIRALNDLQLGAVLKDIGRIGPEEVMKRGGLRAAILQAVFDLPPEEYTYVNVIFGLNGKTAREASEAAKVLNIHPVNVAKKKPAILSALRNIVAAPEQEIMQADPDETGFTAVTPEDVIMTGQLLAQAAAALEKLPQFDRKVVRERLRAESYDELAGKLNTNRVYAREMSVNAFDAIAAGMVENSRDARKRDYLNPLGR